VTVDQPGIRIVGSGVVLREWTPGDLAAMAEIFDDPEVAYRTPIASPFDLEAARAYFERIQRSRAEGSRIHLAITADGGRPCGEVLLNLSGGTIAYTVGAAFRGQGLATRAASLLTSYAHDVLGMAQVRAEIEPDNHASITVAQGIGYRLTRTKPEKVHDGRRSYSLLTWIHEVPTSGEKSS
jgi:RimJ/RimL family protein N-acetyltransferase